MSNPPIDVAELIKLICKIFWSSIYVRLSGKILGDSFEIHILCYFLYSEIEYSVLFSVFWNRTRQRSVLWFQYYLFYGLLYPLPPLLSAINYCNVWQFDLRLIICYSSVKTHVVSVFASQLEIPKQLLDPNFFNAWMVLFLNVLERPVPLEGQPADQEQRKSWGWWKVKKWTVHILNRLYTRLVIASWMN